MSTQLRFTLLLTAGLFLPADALAQGRGGRGSGSGMSGGCRSSGQSPSPPASTSTSSPYTYPYPNSPATSSVLASGPRSVSNAGMMYQASLQSAARQAYLAQLQAAQFRAYQARSAPPQTATLQAAPMPYTATPASPRSEKPAAEPAGAWKPPADEREYVPDEIATIKPDPVAVLATDSATYDRYLKAVSRGDDRAVRDLDASGQVVSLSEPTEVAVLSRAGGFAFVRLTTGPQKDKTFVTRAKLAKPAAK